MKFGVNLITRGPLATAENMARVAQRAEALGFDAAFISDHIVIPKSMPSNYPYHPEGQFPWESVRNYYEPLATLAYLAGKTEKIRLGISVLIISYRNPVVTAKVLATTDALSGGRIILGVGTGWWEDEYRALGIPEHFRERGARTDEYIRIYRTLWREENPEFKGRFHQFGNLEFSPKPHRPEGIPIWVGGDTGRALRRAAELGDAWHPIGQRPPVNLDPAELGHKVETLRKLAEAAGRDPASLAVAFRGPVTITDKESRPLIGSLAQVIDDIHSYESKGVSHLTMDLPADSIEKMVEKVEQIGEEVLPQFA